MPTLCYLFGLRICMFMEKNAPHNFPHFHIFLGNSKIASIEINKGLLIAGSLSRSEQKIIKTFVFEHKKVLLQAWEQLQKGELPPKIKL